MYYYIFDIKKCKKRSQVDAIKSYLLGLGISGEFTYVSSIKSAEELAQLGLKRGYSTIVAVGSDDLINSVANVMIGQKEAMGIIPLETSAALSSLIGVSEWREAADTLRFRRIKELKIGKTASGEHFFTFLTLGIKHPIEITLEFKDYIIQAWVKNLLISNYHPEIKKNDPEFLDIIIESCEPQNASFVSRIKSMFEHEIRKNDRFISNIRARSLRIFSKRPVSLMTGTKIIAKTPQLIETTDETIRLIVSKHSI